MTLKLHRSHLSEIRSRSRGSPLGWRHRICSGAPSAAPAAWGEEARRSSAAGPATQLPCIHLWPSPEEKTRQRNTSAPECEDRYLMSSRDVFPCQCGVWFVSIRRHPDFFGSKFNPNLSNISSSGEPTPGCHSDNVCDAKDVFLLLT